LKINLIYLAGLLSAFHSPTGHPLIEFIVPLILIYTVCNHLKNKGFLIKKDHILLFFIVLFICIIFTSFYILSGQANNISIKYPGIYTSFVYQSLRVLLIPMVLIIGNQYASRNNFTYYLHGLSNGLLISCLSGLFLNFFLVSINDQAAYRLAGLTGEARHLGQLISLTFLLFFTSRASLRVKETRFSKILPLFLTLTFSFTGILTLIAPLISFISFKQIGLLSKLRLSKLFLVFTLVFGICVFIISISINTIFSLRGLTASDFGSNIFTFIDYGLGKDTVPIRYLLNKPLSLIFGAGPSGLQIQFIQTKLSLIQSNPLLADIGIFEGYFNSDTLESILVPSSSLIYIISIIGIIPLILIFRQIKSSIIFKYYSKSLSSSVPFYMALLSITLFASSSNFLTLLFALALSSFEADNFAINQSQKKYL